jgi:rod shape-determining protein MreD
LGLVFAALLLQVCLPLYVQLAGLLDLPLMVLVYLALLRRDVITGLLTGTAVGLAQDGLTHGPMGLFGIIDTVIGYLASSVSLFIEVDYPGARAVLVGLFFLVHQTLFWVIQGALLGNPVVVHAPRTLILGAVHAGLALLLYRAMDRLKKVR